MSHSRFAPLRRPFAPLLLLLLLAVFSTSPAHADRKYFVYNYTPYLAPAGEVEFEAHLYSFTGKQDSGVHTSWAQRFELEYAVTDRFTASAYLNYSQGPGGPMHFDTPSMEFIYTLAERGRLWGDPAFYTELSENGEELEVENKLLLAHRAGRWVQVLNLVSELEFRHNDEELMADGQVFRKRFAGGVSAGITREFGPQVAVGLEGRFRFERPNFDPGPSFLSLGPVVNLQSGKVQLALGSQVQLRGSPQTSGSRNLVDFERMQVRAILGIDL